MYYLSEYVFYLAMWILKIENSFKSIKLKTKSEFIYDKLHQTRTIGVYKSDNGLKKLLLRYGENLLYSWAL